MDILGLGNVFSAISTMRCVNVHLRTAYTFAQDPNNALRKRARIAEPPQTLKATRRKYARRYVKSATRATFVIGSNSIWIIRLLARKYAGGGEGGGGILRSLC